MNDIAVIHLTNGGFTIVDSDVSSDIIDRNWQHSRNGYVYRGSRVGKRTPVILMHRAIMRAAGKAVVDHKNGFMIDNRRSNLRMATQSLNIANSRKTASASSRFKGVSWASGKRKWKAQIKVNYKNHHIGYFTSELEAAKAYNAKAIESFGEFSLLNPI